MNYEEALAFMTALLSAERPPHAAATVVKLERVGELLRRVGNPHLRVPSVLVAGTKGKGSTAAMLSAIMDHSGVQVGLYTKPHLVDYRERIRINDTLIAPDALAAVIDQLQPHIEAMRDHPYGLPTYFEVSVVVAFLYFAAQKVDVAVMEVGLGGRLDATNIADPLVSVITPISYDHMDVLGLTLDAIAREKAGIVRPRGAVVSAPQVPEALAAIIDVCTRQDARLWFVDERMHWKVLHSTLHGQTITLSGPEADYGDVVIPLLGYHQVINAATAVATAEALHERGFRLLRQAVRTGLETVQWPARIEVLDGPPLIVLDVAHNPASMGALRQVLEEQFSARRMLLVFGMIATHDHRACTSLIAPLADVVIVTTPHHLRPLPASVLAEEVRRYVARVEVIEDRFAAVDRALALANPDDMVVVTGSFFLVGDVREALQRKSLRAARTD